MRRLNGLTYLVLAYAYAAMAVPALGGPAVHTLAACAYGALAVQHFIGR